MYIYIYIYIYDTCLLYLFYVFSMPPRACGAARRRFCCSSCWLLVFMFVSLCICVMSFNVICLLAGAASADSGDVTTWLE